LEPSEVNDNRRQFFFALSKMSASVLLATHWPQIAAAAHHAAEAAAAISPAFGFLSPGEAADVEAATARILPGGETPGAREANAAYFIDRALATFFADRAEAFRAGLQEFQGSFRAAHPGVASFARASSSEQIAFLTSVERSAFFDTLRTLTILGTLSSSRYGGNRQNAGWKLMGFEDQHVFNPPFGYYDRDYAGFEWPMGPPGPVGTAAQS
jgi:hypothetical protein